MKAIQIQSPKTFRRIELESPPPPGPGQALVRTHRMGICGTDVSCYLGKFPFFDFPRIPGHELGVEVVKVGDGVTNIKPGDRCSVEPYMHCGQCYACRRGFSNCCANLKVIGVMTDGGLCDEFTIDASKLHSSTRLSFEQLALVETLAIGSRATHRGAPVQNDQVLIIGCGPIGLATVEFTRLTGAEITVMDRSESRLAFCRDVYGITKTIHYVDHESALRACRESTAGDLFQVVTDATGNAGSMSGALHFVAPTGTLVYVGITTGEISFAHPTLHRPEMTIKASRNALPRDFTKIIELIGSGQIDTNPWITHRTTFDQVDVDFERFMRPDSGVVKAIIEVQ